MLIDRAYIISRANLLIEKKQKSSKETEVNRVEKTKQYFPKWLADAIFPLPEGLRLFLLDTFNPFIAAFQQYKATKKKRLYIKPLHVFSTNYLKYYTENDLRFDTSLYYPKEDESAIVSHIDNHLKAVISGCNEYEYTDEQKQILEKREALLSAVKKIDGGFYLSLENDGFFLPSKHLFEEHTYIHHYGLKYLPEYVKDYIAQKDFLDVGAFWGDTTILLAKKYNARHIFCYEPVSQNIQQLENVITRNDLNNRVSVIKKGVADEETQMDIYVNPDKPSSCSINETAEIKNAVKETVPITTIDNECQDRRVGLIKIDIEGAEYAAIKGALNTIKRDKPILLISIYHTGKDFYEIPPMLKEAVPEYLFRFINIEMTSPICEKILAAYPKL